MQTIDVSKILINGNRQRQTFDPVRMQELIEGIKQKGLMHAIVLRETEAGLVLVAGERRLRAIKDMWMLGGQLRFNNQHVPEGSVPYVTLGQLSTLDAEEAELEENLRREDLSWQDNAAALARLHRLRSAQAQSEGRVHTVADTAVEVKGRSDGSYQSAIRKNLIVANHLSNPEVAKAKSSDEAFKILKRQEDLRKNADLAKEVGTTFTVSDHTALNVNCLDWMSSCPPSVFDVILTDPPYGMGAQDFGDGGGGRLSNNEHHYDDSHESWQKLMAEWCPLSFRVAKAQAHAYVFCDIDNFHELKKLMQAAGWYVFRTPFICLKPNSGRVPLPDQGPRRQYETLLYAIKGHKRTTAIYPDVLSSTADSGFNHGAQKPVALFEDLLRRSVQAGDTVLDAFAGTGTIFPAANKFKVKATGLELNQSYFGYCLQRLRELESTPEGDALSAELRAMMGAK